MLMKVSIDAAAWPQALAAAQALVTPYQVMYPRVWPNVGLHFAAVAKLAMLLEQPGAALRAVEKSIESLRITHCGSEGGAVLRDMERLRWEAQHEAHSQGDHVMRTRA
ncbi:hypothetical protein V8C86DRAFT_2877277 [Haematococcus lacustris]